MKPEEIGRWFEEMSAGLVLYARNFVSGPQGENRTMAAEDLVQEAFIRLARQKKAPANVRAWLLLTVRRGAALDQLKGTKRREVRDREAGRARWFERSAAEPTEVEAEEVQAAMRELEMDEREAITLRMWNGATFEEIAAVMNRPLSSVYQMYRSGLEKLRARWELPCRRK